PYACAGATDSRRGAAKSREARGHLAKRVQAAVVDGHHLHVFDLAASVRTLVFDAKIRELDALIHDRQVVLLRPFLDLMPGARGSAVAVRAVAVPLLEELLVVTFELVIEDDALDACTVIAQPFGGSQIRAIALR